MLLLPYSLGCEGAGEVSSPGIGLLQQLNLKTGCTFETGLDTISFWQGIVGNFFFQEELNLKSQLNLQFKLGIMR